MIDPEILTVALKELGYFDDLEDCEKKKEHTKNEPSRNAEDKEHDTKED